MEGWAGRLVRALEVYLLTGAPISMHKGRREGLRGRLAHRIFFLQREREDLYARIDRRVDGMLREGLVEEVRRIRKKKLGRTAAAALGLKEIGEHLNGKCTLNAAADRLKMNTRRFAKRQLAWFRHEKGIEPVLVSPTESAVSVAWKILKKLQDRT